MNELIMTQLDRTKPDWWTSWANEDDLRDLACGYATKDRVRERIASRLFHPILHAALCAGLITEVKP